AGPIVGGALRPGVEGREVTSPADRARVLGQAADAAPADIDEAAALGHQAQPAWDRLGGSGRAPVLRAMADALEADMDRLVALLSREAGKTLNDAVAQVREAADFCRYYALLAERPFPGPEEPHGPVR